MENSLSDAQNIYYEKNRKSMIIAYLFWAFLGGVGVHYFYGGRNYNLLGLLIIFILVGALFFEVLAALHFIIVLIGLVHTYKMVGTINRKVKKEAKILYPCE